VILTFAPGGIRRATMSAVIIFVSDAIGSTRVGSRRHSTRPVSRSNMSPDRGWCLKPSRTRSRGSSSRTDSGEGAVPPPASGAGPESVSGSAGGAVGAARCSRAPSGASVSPTAIPAPSSASTVTSAGHRRRLRRRPPWKTW
jgi:hypothetical protein